MEKFFLVWNEKMEKVEHKFYTEKEAFAEAGRLVRAQPGEIFHILQTIGSRVQS